MQDCGYHLLGLFAALLFLNDAETVHAMLIWACEWFASRGVPFEPARVFTDDSSALYNGLRMTFPYTRLALCCWHICARHVNETLFGHLRRCGSAAVNPVTVTAEVVGMIWALVRRQPTDGSIVDNIVRAIRKCFELMGSPKIHEMSPFHVEQVIRRFLESDVTGAFQDLFVRTRTHTHAHTLSVVVTLVGFPLTMLGFAGSFVQHSQSLFAARKQNHIALPVEKTGAHKAFEYLVMVVFKDRPRIERLFGLLQADEDRFDNAHDNNSSESFNHIRKAGLKS